MSDLIERLEKATEGLPELDAEIWLLVTPGATRKKWSYTHTASGRLCEVDETRNATGRLIMVPAYTTSLDAALTLVPDDPANKGREMLWSITHDEDGVSGPRSYVAALGKGYHDPQYIYGHHTATAALALCIAALKARQP